MSIIDVDLEKLSSEIQEISNYIEILNTKTKETEQKIENMSSSWTGKDYERLKDKWTKLTNSSSISSRTQRELESFKLYLQKCYDEYTKLSM